MAQAAIFDMDGTLVDSVDLHAHAWQDAFAEFGYRIKFAELRSQIGKGGDQLMPCFLSPQELQAHAKQIGARRADIMKERYLAQVRPFPKVRPLLQKLRANNIAIVLAPSAKTSELAVYKRIANIDDLVDAETSADDVAQSKPHPDVFQSALSRLPETVRADAVAIGDTPYDARAAGKAGLRTVGVLCGGFPADHLREAGCIAIYNDPADLLEHFEQSPLGSHERA